MTRPLPITKISELPDLGFDPDALALAMWRYSNPYADPAAAWRRPQQSKPPARRHHKPTLGSVAKHASKAGIAVARYEVKPDGTVVVVTGQPAPVEPENSWPLDEFRTKEPKQ